jgi:hypothetical protein
MIVFLKWSRSLVLKKVGLRSEHLNFKLEAAVRQGFVLPLQNNT